MHGRLGSDFERNEMDTPNLNIVRESRRGLRLYDTSMSVEDDPSTNVEDDASISVEDDAPMSVEGDASMSVRPSLTRRIFLASAVVLFLVGVGGAFVWRSWVLPAGPPAGFPELQEQVKSIAIDLAAVKQTLEHLSVNQDQLTRKQDDMARTQEQMAQSIELQAGKQELTQKLLSQPPVNKPVPGPPPKPLRSAQLPTHASSKPLHLVPPQSLQSPNGE